MFGSIGRRFALESTVMAIFELCASVVSEEESTAAAAARPANCTREPDAIPRGRSLVMAALLVEGFADSRISDSRLVISD
jgi:hypothetical protein